MRNMSLLLWRIIPKIIHEQYVWLCRNNILKKLLTKKKVILRESKKGIGSAYKEAFEQS